MFRRSRIKITPKIPQAKTPATELIDSTRLQQQQNLNQQQIYQQPNGSMQGVGHYGQPQHYSQTLERPRSLGINQIDGFNNMDPITIPQAIPNHPPPAYYPPGSIMNQNPYHTGNQGAINEITSTGSHTPPPSYFATPGTGDSMVSINQMTESQLNQGQPTRRINSQGSSSASITSRPSQPPPAPPSNPPSSGGTSTGGTPSRSRGQSLTRESLPPPPPPPPPPPSTGMDGVVRGDSLHNELPLPPPSGAIMSPPKAYIPSDNSLPNQSSSVPPPPPPPPPEGLLGNPQIKKDGSSVDNSMKNGLGSSLAQEILQKQSQVMQSKTSTMKRVLPQHLLQKVDTRSDLLAAIREGIILRKVDENKQKQIEKSTPLLDVASILARRKAMEYSDSESEAGNSDESGSDNWNDDESEC